MGKGVSKIAKKPKTYKESSKKCFTPLEAISIARRARELHEPHHLPAADPAEDLPHAVTESGWPELQDAERRKKFQRVKNGEKCIQLALISSAL